ncbi:ATP-binding protein [Tepidimonas ignava]|uniref:ATP-binding protein n=1 Tax=Tepidimonas ignava TaxID=114249 RepID=UPI002FDB6C58
MAAPRRKLPIGIQTLRDIRDGGYYYVDKTPQVARLADSGKYYFLSRPRRFGKSLLIDTIAQAFAGQRALFEGGEAAVALGVDPAVANRPRLFLAEHWDWGRHHPVIRLSFAGGRLEQRSDLERSIRRQLRDNAHRLGVALSDPDDVAGSFDELITRAAEAHGQQAVVLVDEYDKPILDNLEAPEVARAMREGLRNLYSVIKGRDADVRFAMLTGVSKFSKVSIFSGLNNLYDLTLDPAYGALCGYTEEDLDTVFAPEFEAAAAEGQPLDRAEVRRWYNGYAWGPTSVYNPFDVLLLDKRQYRAHWFETGTPTFLVQWLQRKGFFTPRLEQLWASEALLSAFDVDGIEPEAMLWQTGYLTIREHIITPRGPMYTLALPNHEVRTALNEALTIAWLPQPLGHQAQGASMRLYQALAQGDTAVLKAHFERLFASIPHDWYRANPIAQYEGYFASVCYSHLASLGVEIIAEDVSNEGQCDLTVKHAGTAWVFEFKVVDGDQGTGEALRQLQAKDYAAKHRGAPGVERVIEVGVEFSRTRRQIVGWDVRSA